MFNEQPKKTSPLNFIVILVLFIGFLAWLLPAMINGDPRWFLPGETPPPAEIVIWRDGEKVTLGPTDTDFPALADAIDAVLNDITGYSDFGASAVTLAEYRDTLALEAFYAEKLKIHSGYGLGSPRQILFPLAGSSYTASRFHLGADNIYWAGSPRTSSLARLQAAVEVALSRQGVATSR